MKINFSWANKFKINRARLKRRGILFKTIMLLWSVILITILLFVTFMIPYQRKMLLSILEAESKNISFSINQITATAVLSGDFSFVVEHCMNVVKENQQIKYIVLTRKSDGFSLIHTSNKWTDKFLHGSWNPVEAKRPAIIFSEMENL